MEIIDNLRQQINVRYQENLEKEVLFNGNCIRFGHKDHGWIYANEWEYKGNKYQEISFGSWKFGDSNSLKSWDSKMFKDKAFKKAYTKKTVEAKTKIDMDQKVRQKECKEKWLPIFKKAKKCTSHGYLKHKGVNSQGNVKVDQNGVLLIPAYDIEGFTGVQRIWEDPESGKFVKRFSFGIKIKGSIFPFKPLKGERICYLTEGYATGATIQELFPDIPVVCCFNASNIPQSINSIRSAYPDIKICIAADNDFATTKPINNPGLYYARMATKRFKNTVYRFPEFETKNSSWTDFNDLAEFESKDKVFDQLIVSEEEFFTVEPLGHNDGNYFYISSENQQIVPLNWSHHHKGGLRRLVAGHAYWMKNYPLQIDDESVKIDWDRASSELMEACHAKGIFDSTKVRGVGIWQDGPHYVINDGETVHNPNPDSKFNYQKTIGVDYTFKTYNSDHILHLLEGFKNLEYKRREDYFYLSAWFIQAQIFTVIPWRFHIWLTGSAGSGKSTVLKWLHDLSINSLITNNATAAGIRQRIKSSAKSIIADETEPDGGKIKGLIEMAREMSTNGEDYEALRGTVSGNALNFNTQCVLCFGSINIGELKPADLSRIFIIDMNTTKNQSEESFADISERIKYFKMHKNQIFSLIYDNIDNILWNTDFCRSFLKHEEKLESRLADQLAIAIACFYVYFNQGKMEKEDYKKIVKEFKLIDSEYTDQNKEKDHESCYENLMSTIVDNYTQTTVAQAIHNIRYSDNENFIYEKMLGNHGLKYNKEDETLFIQNKNQNLKAKLKEFPDLNRILKRDEEYLVREKDRQIITQLGNVRGIRIKLRM